MEHFAGIDVSLELSSVCVVDGVGKIVHEAKVASDPEALVGFFRGLETRMTRIGLKAGPLSQWLYAGLVAAGFEVVLRAGRAKSDTHSACCASCLADSSAALAARLGARARSRAACLSLSARISAGRASRRNFLRCRRCRSAAVIGPFFRRAGRTIVARPCFRDGIMSRNATVSAPFAPGAPRPDRLMA
jgi:hypothetical protein